MRGADPLLPREKGLSKQEARGSPKFEDIVVANSMMQIKVQPPYTILMDKHGILSEQDWVGNWYKLLRHPDTDITVKIRWIKNSKEALIENSIKMQDFKGIINIEIIENNDYIKCRLTDNGPGITDAKKAMTPYFTTKKKGTGLGLPIVSKIINEHSGNFSIKKKKDGIGTIVNLSLPIFNA